MKHKLAEIRQLIDEIKKTSFILKPPLIEEVAEKQYDLMKILINKVEQLEVKK